MVLRAVAGSDVSRLLEEVGFSFLCGKRGSCGKCRVRVISGSAPVTDTDRLFFTEEELESGFRLACMLGTASDDMVIEYTLPDEAMYIPDPGADNAPAGPSFSLAVDIGTTTVAVAAVDTATGQIIDTASGINHQRRYGADVVSRIVASNMGNGPKLRDIIIGDINGLVRQVTEKHGLEPAGLEDIFIVGNTTMLHIFAGYSCEGLGMAPFSPVTLDTVRTGSGILLPGFSAYVGADILAGIYHCGFSDELSLLVDLGTNGELALGTKDRILVASTAAGPAFEGGNISCGTAGIPGAICDVRLSDEDGEEPIVLTLIGGGEKPVGICGTGVIALVSELKRTGIMDGEGVLDPRLKGRIRLTGDSSVTFTQKDVREVQLATAAVSAGIDTLLEAYGAEAEDIRHVYIAGGFGRELDIKKAADIGLIPAVCTDVCEAVGNSALLGAVRFAADPDGEKALAAIKAVGSEVMLADSETFKRLFVEKMGHIGPC